MRPRTEIRRALVGAVESLVNPGTWRDLGQQLQRQGLVNMAAPSEARLVQRTVENMVQAGELERRGQRAVAGSRRPMATYGRRSRSASGWMAGAAGADLAAAWGGMRGLA